jgi:hypothetical protein
MKMFVIATASAVVLAGAANAQISQPREPESRATAPRAVEPRNETTGQQRGRLPERANPSGAVGGSLGEVNPDRVFPNQEGARDTTPSGSK